MRLTDPNSNGADEITEFRGGIHLRIGDGEEWGLNLDSPADPCEETIFLGGIHLRIDGDEWCYLDDQPASAPPDGAKVDKRT
jgi:hypothetical protein